MAICEKTKWNFPKSNIVL